jgi:peptidoglycan/LPS O-acetylase OafA/YrhL
VNPLNPFFSVIILIIAFLSGYIIKLNYKINPPHGRYESIDGMRGFLALSVFIHHSSPYYQYIQTGIWDESMSNLYIQLGETSVSLFFMITSFLFISKLLNSKEKDFNLRFFFLSRIFRIIPMYYFLVLLIIISVMFASHWKMNVGVSEFLISIFNWCCFTIYKTSTINNDAFTTMANGGIAWSLPYEWLFYFSLPLISILILKIRPKIWYIILSVIFIIIFYKIHGIIEYHIYSFMGGGLASILLKFTSFNNKIEDAYGSIIILVCLFLIGQFSTANNIFCILLITIIFTLIALGTSLFGLLKNSTLKFLGEISYSTYLLHGVLLHTVLRFGFGFEKIKHLTPLEYCLVIFSITPALIVISFLGFRYIEKPNIDKSKTIIQKLT